LEAHKISSVSISECCIGYIESNRCVFDKDAFIKEFGADAYAKFTKVSAVFSVKVTSR
jgi:hypothetical protein